MRTTLERELCFQEIAFSTLAGFWHDFPFKIRPKKALKKRIAEVLFRLWAALAALGLSWPLLGLPLASFWPPLAALWPLFGLSWPPLGLLLASLGLPWPPFGPLGVPVGPS